MNLRPWILYKPFLYNYFDFCDYISYYAKKKWSWVKSLSSWWNKSAIFSLNMLFVKRSRCITPISNVLCVLFSSFAKQHFFYDIWLLSFLYYAYMYKFLTTVIFWKERSLKWLIRYILSNRSYNVFTSSFYCRVFLFY